MVLCVVGSALARHQVIVLCDILCHLMYLKCCCQIRLFSLNAQQAQSRICWADVSQKQTALIIQKVQGQGNQLMSHQLQE